MKIRISLFLLFLACMVNAQEIKVISYNIRLNLASDGINAWPNRSEMVGSLLRFHEAEIIGLQEALVEQLKNIEQQLPQMKRVGVGRDDGIEAGEFSPILFDATKFKLIDKGWFWLSETPDKPGWGWDARFNRICTWAKLKPKKGKEFLVLNTHFDHKGDIARAESAKLIIKKIGELNTKHLPVILMGDFNLTVETAPIQYILKYLNDSKNVSQQPAYGPDGTFNGFDFNSKLEEKIDFIFVNDKVSVEKFAVLSDSKNNRYPSDHLPLFVKLLLR